jgi:hypothetical protein
MATFHPGESARPRSEEDRAPQPGLPARQQRLTGKVPATDDSGSVANDYLHRRSAGAPNFRS